MVQAYSSADGYSANSNEAVAIFPAAPTNVTATSGPSGISLRWKNNTKHSAIIHVIRRDVTISYFSTTVSGGGLVNKTTFLDTTAEIGKTYVYVVVVVIELPNQGSVSAEVTATRLAYNTVTVNSGTGGGTYAVGTNVDIKANAAPSGKAFDKWTATGVSLSSPGSANTSFTMPANAVTVAATYKDLPPNTYAVNVKSGEGGTASANVSSAKKGDTVKLSVVENEGYMFSKWQVEGGGISITGDEFVMPANTVTVKAVFELMDEVDGTIEPVPIDEDTELEGEDAMQEEETDSADEEDKSSWLWILFIGLAVLVIAGAAAFFIKKRKKDTKQSDKTNAAPKDKEIKQKTPAS